MTTEIDALAAEHKKFKDEFTEKAKDAMRKAFSAFFATNPTITTIAWTQYTPYFNDGDTCVFGVNEMTFRLESDALLEEDDDEEGHCSFFWDDKGKRVDPIQKERAAFTEFSTSVSRLPDEIFLDAFGDHVKVIATKDGFDVQEYDHD